MRESFYRVGSKAIALVGLVLFFGPILVFLSVWANVGLTPDPNFIAFLAFLAGYAFPGFVLTCIGVIIYKRYREIQPFLAKRGGDIHLGTAWKRGTEPGLFLTTCGLVVSINNDSSETAHVGYRIVHATRATCKECILRRGRAILETQTFRREY
jgi:hypothetical protein